MNIDTGTFEKAIAASCIQLAQAYSVTNKITIDEAKIEVAKYLSRLKDFQLPVEYTDGDSPVDFKTLILTAAQVAQSKPEKAYLELLKLREYVN